jgi:hypothetical protein
MESEFRKILENICQKYLKYRTREVFLINDTPYECELFLYRAQDTQDLKPTNDYIDDTGVVVGAVGQPGNQKYISDPCYAGGIKRPIMGTRITGGVQLKGFPKQIDFPVFESDPGTYYGSAGWRIAPKLLTATGEIDPTSVVVELLQPMSGVPGAPK